MVERVECEVNWWWWRGWSVRSVGDGGEGGV